MKKIKTGVVGYGFSGRIFQCPFIEAHDAFELTAIVQRNSNSAQKDYPNILLYKDYTKLLQNKEIDLVVISTPSHLHFEQAKQALLQDKHVLVEKPFTATYEEAVELIEIAKGKNKIITVYQNRRFDGDFLTIKRLISNGVLIKEYDATWDRFALTSSKDWKEAGYKGADLLYDLGTHFLDQALYLFGEPQSFHKITHKLRENTNIIDFFSMHLVYKDKVVRLKSNMLARKQDVRYKLHTDQGSYYFYEMGEQEHQLLAGMKPDDKDYGDNAIYHHFDIEGTKHKYIVEKGNYMGFFTELANAILFDKTPPVSMEQAALVIKYLTKEKDDRL